MGEASRRAGDTRGVVEALLPLATATDTDIRVKAFATLAKIVAEAHGDIMPHAMRVRGALVVARSATRP